MIRNYILIAWRNLLKYKVITGINLLGLTVAFTVCLLLVLSVCYEFSYDKFHVNGKDIYRTYFSIQTLEGNNLQASMPYPMMDALKEECPEIKYGSRYNIQGGELEYNGKHAMKTISYVDRDFFSMFSFRLIRGHITAALSHRNNIVLDEETAQALFGEEDPLNKQVKMQAGGSWRLYTVSGIVERTPGNSSVQYSVLTLFENDIENNKHSGNWYHNYHDLFVQLLPGTDPRNVEAHTQHLISKQYQERIAGMKRDGVKPAENGQYVSLLLQPLLSLHTDTSVVSFGSVISRTYLNILLAVACFVMVIACINFINLKVGRSFTRCLEVGLRKTMGASSRQLAMQFWGEAVLTCFMALLLSIPLFFLLLPHYKEIFESSLTGNILFQPATILFILICFLVITVIAGGYPAWIMARLNARTMLKGKLQLKTSAPLRSGLIISQFAVAILLISCTLVTWKQLSYLRNRPLGYNKEQVISIPVGSEVNGKEALELLRQKLEREPFAVSATGLSDNFGEGIDGSDYKWGISFDYKERTIGMRWLNVGYDFIKTTDLTLLSGRDFNSADSEGIIINEQMALQMGEKDPVGIKLIYDPAKTPLTVIGVVKDFNFLSLRNKVEPLGIVMYSPIPVNFLLVKVRPDNLPAAMDKLSAIWSSIAPNTSFKGSFIDENINRQYLREERLTRIFIYAAIIAITLSCMGLFALAVLLIMQRTREIGIRKVMGASAGNILELITFNFIKLILIAMVIATPLAYYFMNNWLKSFAFGVKLEWWWLLIAGLLALTVALCTIGYQSLKAAFMNPSASLKSD